MTSLPSSSTPAPSQPRIIGSRSAGRPTPRRDQTSWWFSPAARTSTTDHPGRGSGRGRSPTSSPDSGSSLDWLTAKAASMPPTLLSGRAPRSAEPRPAPARQSRSGARPARCQASWPSTEYAGRGAGRGNAAVVVGRTRSGSSPSPAKTSRARPYHVVSPALVAWYVAVRGAAGDQPLDRAGHVHRPGGLTALVVHHVEGVPLGGEAGHRRHEVRAAAAVQPRGAHDPGCAGTGRPRPTRRPPWSARTPTAAPAAAASAYGRRGVTGEDVVGGDLHQLAHRPRRRRGPRSQPRWR